MKVFNSVDDLKKFAEGIEDWAIENIFDDYHMDFDWGFSLRSVGIVGFDGDSDRIEYCFPEDDEVDNSGDDEYIAECFERDLPQLLIDYIAKHTGEQCSLKVEEQ